MLYFWIMLRLFFMLCVLFTTIAFMYCCPTFNICFFERVAPLTRMLPHDILVARSRLIQPYDDSSCLDS